MGGGPLYAMALAWLVLPAATLFAPLLGLAWLIFR